MWARGAAASVWGLRVEGEKAKDGPHGLTEGGDGGVRQAAANDDQILPGRQHYIRPGRADSLYSDIWSDLEALELGSQGWISTAAACFSRPMARATSPLAAFTTSSILSLNAHVGQDHVQD